MASFLRNPLHQNVISFFIMSFVSDVTAHTLQKTSQIAMYAVFVQRLIRRDSLHKGLIFQQYRLEVIWYPCLPIVPLKPNLIPISNAVNLHTSFQNDHKPLVNNGLPSQPI